MRVFLLNFVNQFKKSTILKSFLLLGFSGVLCKLIGVFYRIPLTSILGGYGIGVYQQVFPIYSFLLVLSSSAIPVAISKIVSEKMAMNDYVYISTLKAVAIRFMLVVCFCLMLLTMLLSGVFASLQGGDDAVLAFICIAPSILLVGLLCVYRGIFQGFCDVKPTSISQLVEQVVKLVLGLFFAWLFTPFGVSYAVAGAVLGVSFSELFALVYILILFNHSKLKLKLPKCNASACEKWVILKHLLKVLLPICVSGLVVPLCLVVDSFLIINLLTSNGVQNALAITSYGLYSGVVSTLVNVPVVVASSLGIVFLPLIAKLKNQNNIIQIAKNCGKCFDLVLIISMPCFALFLLFPSPILTLLYPSLSLFEVNLSADLLQISSIIVVALSIYYATSSILQGMGRSIFPCMNVLVFSLLRLCLYFGFIPSLNILAVAWASSFAYVLMAFFNVFYLVTRVDFFNVHILRILSASVVFVCIIFLIFLLLSHISCGFAFCVAVFVSFLIYILLNFRLLL